MKNIFLYSYFLLNIIFSADIIQNGLEIFSINSDAQIGGLGGSNPALSAINGQVFNNPALGHIKTTDFISFTYRKHFSGLAKDHIFSSTIKQKIFQSLSIGVIYREIENIPNTLDAFYLVGNSVQPIDYNLITYFNHWELASIFSFSSTISKYKLGFNVKTLMYSLYNEKAYGIGFDLGTINYINDSLLVGIIIKNIPVMYINWTTGKEEIALPQLGIGLNYKKNKFIMVSGIELNLNKTNLNEGVIINCGIKKEMNKFIKIISGYNNQRSYSLGLEIKYQPFIINYSYINSSIEIPFKSSHEITFGIDIEKLNYLSDYVSP